VRLWNLAANKIKNKKHIARQHLLPKSPENICVMQLASRDRIPLPGNTWDPLHRMCNPIHCWWVCVCVCVRLCVCVSVCVCVCVCIWRAGIHVSCLTHFVTDERWQCHLLWLSGTILQEYVDCHRCVTLLTVLQCVCVCVCVCVLANCMSAHVISIQRGSGLSQALRRSTEGSKNTCQNIVTLRLIAGRPVGCNFDKWHLIGHTAASAYWWVSRRREREKGRWIIRRANQCRDGWQTDETLFRFFSNRIL